VSDEILASAKDIILPCRFFPQYQVHIVSAIVRLLLVAQFHATPKLVGDLIAIERPINRV
jgi:hypothetical protein